MTAAIHVSKGEPSSPRASLPTKIISWQNTAQKIAGMAVAILFGSAAITATVLSGVYSPGLPFNIVAGASLGVVGAVIATSLGVLAAQARKQTAPSEQPLPHMDVVIRALNDPTGQKGPDHRGHLELIYKEGAEALSTKEALERLAQDLEGADAEKIKAATKSIDQSIWRESRRGFGVDEAETTTVWYQGFAQDCLKLIEEWKRSEASDAAISTLASLSMQTGFRPVIVAITNFIAPPSTPEEPALVPFKAILSGAAANYFDCKHLQIQQDPKNELAILATMRFQPTKDLEYKITSALAIHADQQKGLTPKQRLAEDASLKRFHDFVALKERFPVTLVTYCIDKTSGQVLDIIYQHVVAIDSPPAPTGSDHGSSSSSLDEVKKP